MCRFRDPVKISDFRHHFLVRWAHFCLAKVNNAFDRVGIFLLFQFQGKVWRSKKMSGESNRAGICGQVHHMSSQTRQGGCASRDRGHEKTTTQAPSASLRCIPTQRPNVSHFGTVSTRDQYNNTSV